MLHRFNHTSTTNTHIMPKQFNNMMMLDSSRFVFFLCVVRQKKSCWCSCNNKLLIVNITTFSLSRLRRKLHQIRRMWNKLLFLYFYMKYSQDTRRCPGNLYLHEIYLSILYFIRRICNTKVMSKNIHIFVPDQFQIKRNYRRNYIKEYM